MNKNDIQRKDLTQNIMQQVVFRIDYHGITDVEKFIVKIEDWLFKYFSSYEIQYANQVNINLPNPKELSKSLSIPTSEIKKQPIHVFTMNTFGTDDLTLSITKYSTDLNIVCKDYRGIDEYLSFFSTLINKLKINNNFLIEKRFGLRKISWDLFENIEDSYNMFERNILNLEVPEFQLINSNISETLLSSNKNTIRYSKKLEDGEALINGNKVPRYRVLLDFDGYFDEFKIRELNWKDEDSIISSLKILNFDLFELFKHSVTESFLQNNTK